MNDYSITKPYVCVYREAGLVSITRTEVHNRYTFHAVVAVSDVPSNSLRPLDDRCLQAHADA